MDSVFILEHRTENKCGCMETVIVFVGSSIEKVEDFIKNNTNYDDGYFWWVAMKEYIDKDVTTYDSEYYIYDRYCNKLDNQPLPTTDEDRR